MRLPGYLFFWLLLLFISCTGKPEVEPLFSLVKGTGITFENKVHNTKEFNIFSYRNFYNGGGVAIGDINNDGLADVFFTANMSNNKLYLNKGDFNFDDITDQAGIKNSGKWGTGVVMVDINADNWLDIYVCNAGYQQGVSNTNELYINNQNGTFTESAALYGLNETGYTTHAAFFDYDLDGDLDCYLLKNSFIPVNTLNYANKRELRAEDWPVADFLKGGGDKLLQNNNGKFTDVSKQANIYGSLIGFGLGVTVGDVNADHYPDLYISNDFFERDYLYINQGNGTFKEDLEQWVQHTSLASMGADIGDINNDGYADIFTTDMLPSDDYRLKTTSLFDNTDVYKLKVNSGFYHQFMQNTLQLNNQNGKFYDVAHYSGVAASDWSWGGIMFDADNDGLSDLFVCNGIYQDVTDQDFIEFFANDVIQGMVMTGKKEEIDQVIHKMPSNPIPNKIFKNLGNIRFSDEGENWGLTQSSFSNGAAYGDLDNDGDLDLVVNNVNEPSFVYRNNSRELSANNYIGFMLKAKAPNTFAVGAAIKVYSKGQVLSREVIPSRGFQSSVDYKAVIGLGKNNADSVVITWPDRSSMTLQKPGINKVHTIVQKEELKPINGLVESGSNKLFTPVSLSFGRHTEDEYVDFYYERGVPCMLSKQGPKAAIADVNGDGLNDIYVGGSAAQPGQLYVGNTKGFIQKLLPQTSGFEETAVVFFDANKDGHIDLVTGSGGNHFPANSFQFQVRLFLNDGKGNFSFVANAFPGTGVNTAVLAVNDFDNDGDEDLFVGSKSVPQNYGIDPPSFLFANDGKGKFTDVTKTVVPQLTNVGLVSDAIWINLVGDAGKELVIAGEWMQPKIYRYAGTKFTEVETNLSELKGWWQCITSADLDNDGDEDLVLGNIGENSYLQSSKERPVKMWVYDFDNNGTKEKIITRSVNGKDVPVFLKKDITDQVPALKKQNLTYKEYASKSIQDLFPKDVLDKAEVKIFNYPSSCIAFNEGNGKFTVSVLPPHVQFSSVNAISVFDVNKDGKKDIVMAGNDFDWLPQFSRLDASYGHVLINGGNRKFNYLLPAASGLDVRGATRDIITLEKDGRQYVLFLQNNDSAQFYTVTR